MITNYDSNLIANMTHHTCSLCQSERASHCPWSTGSTCYLDADSEAAHIHTTAAHTQW